MNFLNLGSGYVLSALAVLVGVVGISRYGRWRRRRRLLALLGPLMVDQVATTVHGGARRLRDWLFLAGVAFCLLAAARPWWGQRLVPYPSRSRDVLILLDCSRSMLADDVAPNRLEHGKWLIRRLAERFLGDRFGIVAFAGEAFLECPLTHDRNTLFLFLNELNTRTIPVGGTNIGAALDVAKQAFKAAEGGNRAILLVTDGEELQGDSRSRVGALREAEIPLLVVGLGNPLQGSTIRDEQGNYLRDREGNLVITRLDEARLKELAVETGGLYVRSTTVEPNLEPLIERLKSLVPLDSEEQVRKREIERYQGPLALGVGCFLVALLVGERRREARRVVAAALVLAVLLVPAAGRAQVDPLGNGAPGREPSSHSRRQLGELRTTAAAAAGAERGRLHYQLGLALQREGDWQGAIAAYQVALRDGLTAPEVTAAAHWNLGVCRHQLARRELLGKPDEAIKLLAEAQEQYRQALRGSVDTEAVGRNQELLLGERELAKAVKEQIEQLSELNRQAEQETRQAAADQEQANQESDPARQPQMQEQAKRQTDQAAAAVDRLRQALDALKPDGQDIATPADQAAAALERARQQQQMAGRQELDEQARQQAGRQAAQELADALDALAGPPPEADTGGDHQQGQADQQDSPADKGEPDGDGQRDANQQEAGDTFGQDDPQAAAQAGDDQADDGQADEADGQGYDREQAAALLRQMQQQEQDFREAVREFRARQLRLAPVDKDW